MVPLAKEGRALCLVAVGATVATWIWLPVWVALPCTLAALFCLNFFRDPERRPPADPAAILSPADGRIVAIGPHEDPYVAEPAQRISIFMSVFNVHVNRAPVTGTVESVSHQSGKFLNAMLAAASEHNEQTRMTVAHERGRMTVTQIAGLVARRIICYCRPGGRMERGQRIGMIRFGSRLDVVVPARCKLRVRIGDKVKAGETVLGSWV